MSDSGASQASVGGNVHLGATWISADGMTWATGAKIETARFLWGVAYGHGRFVAVGAYSGTPTTGGVRLASYMGDEPAGIWSSTDGRTWREASLPAGRSGEIRQVVFGSSGFLGVGGELWTSPDGVLWTSHPYPAGASLDGVVADPAGGYVAVGWASRAACVNGSGVAAWRSSDGITWTRATGPADDCGTMASVAELDGSFVAVGLVGGPSDADPFRTVSWTSADGATWSPPVPVEDVASAWPRPPAITVVGRTYVAVGADFWESTDGRAWVKSALLPPTEPGALAQGLVPIGGGLAMALGPEGGQVWIAERSNP